VTGYGVKCGCRVDFTRVCGTCSRCHEHCQCKDGPTPEAEPPDRVGDALNHLLGRLRLLDSRYTHSWPRWTHADYVAVSHAVNALGKYLEETETGAPIAIGETRRGA
jgi:hypothetical protein